MDLNTLDYAGQRPLVFGKDRLGGAELSSSSTESARNKVNLGWSSCCIWWSKKSLQAARARLRSDKPKLNAEFAVLDNSRYASISTLAFEKPDTD